MQHSIFEPLYSLQAHTMELECLQAPAMPAFAPSLFSISPPSLINAFNRDTSPPSSFDQEISCTLHAHIVIPPSSSHYKKTRSVQDFTSHVTHAKLPLSHPTLSATPPSPCSNGDSTHSKLPLSHPTLSAPPPSPCSNGGSTHSKLPLSHPTTFSTPRAPSTPCSNSDDARKCVDDGSVASKLLSSITKSISSPSLHLSSCKEAARETPYQKTLKLKHMKLQHCAEALGMESSDNSSFFYDSQCIHQEKIDMIGNPSSSPPSFTLPNSHQDQSSLKSVKSAPNLSAPSTNHSRYARSTSFPPPLSHTLPTSSSCDALSLSLRAYREDGRFILKETMVPSRHYFHASRRNGRLTLHVLTREAEEEESIASQDDDDEKFSNKDCHQLEGEEEEVLECMEVSLCEEAIKEVVDNKEEDSHNTITQSLNEEVCVKEILGMDTFKEQRVNCLAIDHNNKKDSEDDVKRNGEMIDFGQLSHVAPQPTTTRRQSCPQISSHESQRNVISNVITLSLQTSCHSKLTMHKAQVLSFPYLSSYPLASGTLKQSALTHSSDGLLPRNHDMTTFTQSNENFIWDSDLMPHAVASGSPCRQRKGGGGSTLPAFVMEEMRVKSLMKAVSELATSLMLEASHGRGNWCLAGEKNSLLSGGESGTIFGGYASAIKGGECEGQISHGATFGDEGQRHGGHNNLDEEGGIRHFNVTPSSLHFPSSNANLQTEFEWLHMLRCKELFDRHHLGQGFIKLHCIPTRS